MSYSIEMSANARLEILEYIEFIEVECSAPLTAVKHYDGVMKTLFELRRNPFISAKQDSITLERYGYGVRRVNFKKMAIIYTVSENTIYIHRFIAQSMIKGL